MCLLLASNQYIIVGNLITRSLLLFLTMVPFITVCINREFESCTLLRLKIYNTFYISYVSSNDTLWGRTSEFKSISIKVRVSHHPLIYIMFTYVHKSVDFKYKFIHQTWNSFFMSFIQFMVLISHASCMWELIKLLNDARKITWTYSWPYYFIFPLIWIQNDVEDRNCGE